jgi:serine/threonine protein kinase
MREWEVPGYTELRVLGSGGFGEVVLARHDASGALVAVKYLRGGLLEEDPGFAAMFRAEARVLASLEDPNVVRLYEYVESPAGAAIVMELVDGVSLREIVSRYGKTSAELALVVLQGSLLGLAAAHARGVVHRDYKPENVLVDGAGVSKLTDFGIAARAGDRAAAIGTLAYAPPEQFAGGPASPAGDVYAATATFYECLAGHPPFGGDTAEVLMSRHLSEPVPLEPVPEPLRPLITAGMAKDPAGRPADAARFVVELRAVAGPAYGPGWEDRGRSHLGEAALLLAALWPSGAAPAVGGHAVQQVRLSRPGQPPHNVQPSQGAQPSHNVQPSQGAQPSQGSPGSEHLRHLEHLRHVEHLEHLEHVEHLEHLEHLEQSGQSPPGHPGPSTPAAGQGARSAHVTAGTGAGASATGAAAAAAGATPLLPSPPPVTRLQRLVRNASHSNRLPRRLRRAIPQNAGPGTSIAIVTGAIAAAVVVIAVIAVAATALTSGNPTPQAGPAAPSASTATSTNTRAAPAPAAPVSAAPSASATSLPGSCDHWPNNIIYGTAALPITTASLGQSLQQLIATCTGVVTSVTCSTYFQYEPDDYLCSIPAQVGMPHMSVINVKPTLGYWQYTGEGS